MDSKKIRVEETQEFSTWLKKLTRAEIARINARVSAIKLHNHFGDCKYLGDNLAELRWRNGYRVYFTKLNQIIVVLLLGGKKNDQKKDIKKARLLLRRYAVLEEKKRGKI